MWNSLLVDRLRSRPLASALLAAAVLHLLAAPLLLRAPRRSTRIPTPAAADDAPMLLRIGASLQSRLNADLAAQRRPLALTLPAPAALMALPPPPPPLETLPAAGQPARNPTRNRPAAGRAAADSGAATAPAAAAIAAPGPGGGAPGARGSSRLDRLLPAQPVEALRLALAWTPGQEAREAAGEQANQAFSEAGFELRRRQLLLSGPQAGQLQRILQAAPVQPSPFADLPAGVQVRRVAASALEPLGVLQPHGVSLLHREALVLAWRQGADLLLLSRPLE